MSAPIHDGGPAFPIVEDHGSSSISPGMTLRDYLAAKALSGLCANPGGPFQASDSRGWILVNCTIDEVAVTAYDLADAMLKARTA